MICSRYFYEPVLHPVLAYLSGFSVCDQFVGIKCHIKIQVIVDHDLNGLSGQAFPFVFVHGFSVDSSVGTETVAVDPAVFHKFLVKFRNDLPVVFGGNIAQSVLRASFTSASLSATSRFGARRTAGSKVPGEGRGPSHAYKIVSILYILPCLYRLRASS